jgi:hypothetical protein
VSSLPIRSVLAAAIAGALALCLVAPITGCGTGGLPGQSGDGMGHGGPDGATQNECALPNQGCPCSNAGENVPCGKVVDNIDGFVTCADGTRTCGPDHTWGDCNGPLQVQTKALPVGGSLRAENLGSSSACASNPCDPYCNVFNDNPTGLGSDGGISVTEGGITLGDGGGGGGGGGGATGGPMQTTSNGLSNCPPSNNVVSGTCNASPLTSCQQDFHCDAPSNSCVWNGGQGYFDPTAGGIDLTAGAACADGGGNQLIPVCNRGTSPVAGSVSIGINITNPPTAPAGCTAIGAPDCFALTPAAGLPPGACMTITCNVPGNKFAVVNAGNRDVTEAPGRCANNAAYVKTAGPPGCASCQACNTTVTGTVMDPGKNVGLMGISVYQPAAAVTPIVDNLGGLTAPPCDSCSSLEPAARVSTALTDVNGNFTLTNVAPGPATIVSQTGRWRRVVHVTVNACTNNVLTNDQIRMPANRAEGDIPKMAMVIGDREALECWLLKIGISSSEIKPYATPTDANRIQLFRTDGETTSSGLPPTGDSLWGSCTAASGCTAANSGALNEYSALLLPCDSQAYSPTGSQLTRMLNYANAGGRIFMDHLTGEEWLAGGPSPWNTSQVSTWQGNTTPTSPAKGQVQNVAAPQAAFSSWLGTWANLPYGGGWLQSTNPRSDALTAGAATTPWIQGRSDNDWTQPPDYAMSFSFETPVGGSPNYCGRVMYNGMHVSQSRASGAYPFTTGSTFPTACDTATALTPEEKALEYQFFQLTACALGGAPPPPPPPPPPSATFTRDYQAVCSDPSTCPVWQSFTWQASIPAGTNIAFRAASASTQAALPASPPAAAPTTVPIGNATTSVAAPSWGTDANTVDWHLRNEPPGPLQKSQSWLRVYMTLNPNGYSAPTLSAWQQFYDCVPCQ